MRSKIYVIILIIQMICSYVSFSFAGYSEGGTSTPLTITIPGSKWTWDIPYPQGNTLNDAWGTALTNIYAVGNAGTIIHYDGYQFNLMDSPVTNNLNSVWGINQRVYVVGDNGVFLYFNGNAWEKITTDSQINLNSVWGISDSKLYLVGNEGTVLLYNGNSVSPMSSPSNKSLYGIHGRSDTEIYSVGASGTVITFNGVSWESYTIDTFETLSDVYCDNDNIVITGENGTIFHNMGNGWDYITGITDHVNAISGNNGTLFAVSDNGNIFRYQSSWQFLGAIDPKHLYGVWNQGTSCFVVGYNGMIGRISDDSGEKLLLGDGIVWSCLFGLDKSSIYAVGSNGTISKYDGLIWNFQREGSSLEWLSDIWGPDTNTLYAVGKDGLILYYDGQSWTTKTSPTSNWLLGIHGNPDGQIFAVGASGTILYLDQTNTWQSWISYPQYEFSDLWASNQGIFVVGSEGVIYHYDGSEWLPQTSPVNTYLHAIWGRSDTNVYAVGENGTIIHYDGAEWKIMNSPTQVTLREIWGNEQGELYATGDQGVVMRNFGYGWIKLPISTHNTLQGVWGSANSTLFAAGTVGTILRLQSQTGNLNELSTSMNTTSEPVYITLEDPVSTELTLSIQSDNQQLLALQPNYVTICSGGTCLSGTTLSLYPVDSQVNIVLYLTPMTDQVGTATITLQTNGNTGITSTSQFILNVTQDSNPTNHAPTIPNGQVFTIKENSSINTLVGTVFAEDQDLDSLTFSIGVTQGEITNGGDTMNMGDSGESGDTGSSEIPFIIDSSTGEIRVNGILDYEQTPSYYLTINVSDSLSTSSEIIEILIKDLNDNSNGAGYALSFDGVDDYIDISSIQSLPGSKLSIEAWIYINSHKDTNRIFQHAWLEKNGSYLLSINANGDLSFAIYDGNTQAQSVYSNISTKIWHHVAAVYNSSTLQVYVDGIPGQSATISTTLDQTGSILISDPNTNNAFSGLIDDLRFYNSALDQNTIQKNMNQRMTANHPHYQGLIAYYPFDIINENIVKDDSINGFNGTCINLTIPDDYISSFAPIGNQSLLGTGNVNITSTPDIPVEVIWSKAPDTNAIFSVIQINGEPGIIAGLPLNHLNQYWHVWMANNTNQATGDIFIQFDNIGDITDEHDLELYARYSANHEWIKYSDATIHDNGDPLDGSGYISIDQSNASLWNNPGFNEIQAIQTMGAMDWEFFVIDNQAYLAVANYTSTTTCNITSDIYQWDGNTFTPFQSINTQGAMDWTFFTIDNQYYLAVANHYNDSSYEVDSIIYQWNQNTFTPIQTIGTQGAKGWTYFTMNDNHFLALANNRNDSTYQVDSKIFQWNGTQFDEIQSIQTNGATDWDYFLINNQSFLAVANSQSDTQVTTQSTIYQWNGVSFDWLQSIDTKNANQCNYFMIDNEHYLFIANRYDGSSFNTPSQIYKWNGSGFTEFQTIDTKGAVDSSFFESDQTFYLMIANSQNDFTTTVNSMLYQWDGSTFQPYQTIMTQNAQGVIAYDYLGQLYLALAQRQDGLTEPIESKRYLWSGYSQFILGSQSDANHFVPDLSISMVDSPDPVAPGNDIIFTLTISNLTAIEVDQAMLTANLPQELQSIEYSNDLGNSFNTWTGSLAIESINQYTPIVILIKGLVDSNFSGTILSTFTISTSNDAQDDNNSVTESTSVLAQISHTTILTDTVIQENDSSLDSYLITIGDGVNPVTLTIAGAHTFSGLTITQNAVLTHIPCGVSETTVMALTIQNNLIIDQGGVINANNIGFLGANQSNNIGNYGRTTGNDVINGSFGSAGGSYGGKGGSATIGEEGDTYADPSNIYEPGAGGGASNESSFGGNGGGFIRLMINKQLINNGLITANGGNGLNDAGGGSGGSIYISAKTFMGDGQITANGGNGGDSAFFSTGGGGGGRIAIFSESQSFNGAFIADGGQGDDGNNGEHGTVYLNSTLIFQNRLSITGTCYFGSENTLQVTIGGLQPETDYNNLAITGALNLAGKLLVVLDNQYMPQLGDTFPIISYFSGSNIFDETIFPSLNQGGFDISYESNGLTLTVADIAVNQAPVIYGPDTLTMNMNETLIFSSQTSQSITIDDIDAGTNSVSVQLMSDKGTFTVVNKNSVSFSDGDGSGPLVIFTGTIENSNLALDGLIFTPSQGIQGVVQINIQVNDLGNTGAGGSKIASKQIMITISESDDNHAPVINEGQRIEINENQSINSAIQTITAYDEDQNALNFSIVNSELDKLFAIEKETGVISLKQALDYETVASYTLTISVSDGISSTTAQIPVTIIDINDNMSGPGWSISLDGIDDYIDISGSDMKGLSQFTIEAWIQPNSSNSQQTLIGASFTDCTDQFNWAIQPNGQLSWQGTTQFLDPLVTVSSSSLSPVEWQVWQHVAIVVDIPLNEVKFGINGQWETISVNFASATFDSRNIQSIYIGRMPCNENSIYTHYSGKMDTIRLYSKAIAPHVMNEWMTQQLTPDYPNYNDLMGCFLMNETKEDIVYDTSKTSSNGLVNHGGSGTVWASSDAIFGERSISIQGAQTLTGTITIPVHMTILSEMSTPNPILCAVQNNAIPGVIAGLPNNFASTYWTVWLSHQKDPTTVSIDISYNEFKGIGDESALVLYGRKGSNTSWHLIDTAVVQPGQSNFDGIGSIFIPNVDAANWRNTNNMDTDHNQFILASTTDDNNFSSDIWVTIQTQEPAVAGTDLLYTLIASNSGPMTAYHAIVRDNNGSGILFDAIVSMDNGQTWIDWNNKLTIEELPVNQPLTLLIKGKIPPSFIGSIENTASIESESKDFILSNNNSTLTTQVSQQADLEISQLVMPAAANGHAIYYTVYVLNNGPSDAMNVVISDTIPKGITQLEFTVDNGLTWQPWQGLITLDEEINPAQFYRIVSINPKSQVSNYQLRIRLTPDSFDYSHCRSDGADIRFFDDQNTPLSYWVETWNPNGDSIIWVLIPRSEVEYITFWYGKQSLTTMSDGVTVFEFFDDFKGTALNSTIWQEKGLGNITVSDGMLLSQGQKYIATQNRISSIYDYYLEFRGSITPGLNDEFDFGFGSILSEDNIHTQERSGEWITVYTSKLNTAFISVKTTDLQFCETNSNIMGIQPGSMATYSVRFKSDSMSFFQNYVKTIEKNSTCAQSSTSLSILMVLDHDSTGTNPTHQIDWIRLRKYLVDEPSSTLSNEYQTVGIHASDTTIIVIRGLVEETYTGTTSHSITVTTDTLDNNELNNTQTKQTAVSQAVNLSLTLISEINQVNAGQNVTYGFNIQNLGPGMASSIQLMHSMDQFFNTPIYSLDEGQTWQALTTDQLLGGLSVNESLHLSIQGTMIYGFDGIAEIMYYVQPFEYDPYPDNNGYVTTIQVSNPVFTLSGVVSYYATGEPVYPITITLAGDVYGEFLANQIGQYTISDLSNGVYTMGVSKDESNSILTELSALDVSRIARHGVGLFDLSCMEKIAADVTLDGTISATDAARVGRYALGLRSSLNTFKQDWVFIPDPIQTCENWPPITYEKERTLSSIQENKLDQHFTGIRLGDVNGSWSGLTTRRYVIPLDNQMTNRQSVIELKIDTDDEIRIPVMLTDTQYIEGIDIELNYDSKALQFIEATLETGILYQHSYQIIVNALEANKIKILIYAQGMPIRNKGEFVLLRFNWQSENQWHSDLSLSKFLCNESKVSDGFYVNEQTANGLKLTRNMPSVQIANCPESVIMSSIICHLKEFALDNETKIDHLVFVINGLKVLSGM